MRQGSRHYQSCICELSHSRRASEPNAPNIPALGVGPSFVNNRNPCLSERSGTNAVEIGPSPLGAGFSETSSGFASGLAMGRALVVADRHNSTPVKAAAAITAPMNFNKTALNLRPRPRKAVLETRRPLRRRAALSIQKVSAQTVCRRSLRMPTSHVLAVCAPTHSDYRGQRLYRAGHTPAESTCANVSLSIKCEILGVLPSAFLPHRYRIFQPSTQAAMSLCLRGLLVYLLWQTRR